MLRHLTLGLALTALTLAGCADDGPSDGTPGSLDRLLLAGPALWEDPQNAPHPKWGWATLSNPPEGELPHPWIPIPARDLPQPITGLEHVAQALNGTSPFDNGAGMALFGHVAVVPGEGNIARFVDLYDPTAPVQVGQVESAGRGAAIIAYPDGRLVTAMSTGSGFDVVEFTDPTKPVLLTQVEPTEGGHKLGVVPGTPILYNAASAGGSPLPIGADPSQCSIAIEFCVGHTSIYNLTDPANPVLVQEFANGVSCHHVFFWNDASQGKFRAICAGNQYTQIWDTADPEHPEVVVSLPVHLGVPGTPSAAVLNAVFSHSAGLSRDGTILYVGDEYNGGGGNAFGLGPGPSGCVLGVNSPFGNAGTPIGAVWFYDVSDEANPVPLGYFAPPQDAEHAPTDDPTGYTCTAHHGRLVPDPDGRDLLAMGFYDDGVILIDFTGIQAGTLPTAVAEFNDGAKTWEAWYANGYIVTGDLQRGLDVLSLT